MSDRVGKEKKIKLIGTILLWILALLICSLSKNSFISDGIPLTDSSVFQYIGYQMWKHGGIPYVDFFDHKGPVIYFVNMLGTYLSLRYGIFLIELLFMMVTLFFSWKTLAMFSDHLTALFSTILCYLFLYDFFECGNLVEEYAMAFMAVSIYLFSDYYKQKKVTCLRIIIIGICFASVLFLIPNMIGIWLVFCAGIFIQELITKNYIFLIKVSGLFLLGVFIVSIPILVYLWYCQALKLFWDCYITFNFEYSGFAEGSAIQSFYSYLKSEFFIITICFWGIAILGNKRESWFWKYYLSALIALIVSVLLCCVSGNPVPHYLMTVFPIAAVGYGIGVPKVLGWMNGKGKVMILLGIGLQLMMFPKTYFKFQDEQKVNFDQVIGKIQEYSDENDRITVYGNACKYYLISERTSVSRYMYQYPIGDVRVSIMDAYFNDLCEKEPKMIIVDHTFDMAEENNERMERLIVSYDLLYEEEDISLWIKGLE